MGPLALWASHRFRAARVTAVDTNLLAVAITARNDSEGRVRVLAQDGIAERFDLVLTNPPTHADADTLDRLFAPLHPTRLFAVATRPHTVAQALDHAGFRVALHAYARYTVIEGALSLLRSRSSLCSTPSWPGTPPGTLGDERAGARTGRKVVNQSRAKGTLEM